MRNIFFVLFFLASITPSLFASDSNYTKEALYLKKEFSRAFNVEKHNAATEIQLFLERLVLEHPRHHAPGKWIDDIKVPIIKNNEYKISRLSDTTLFKLPRKIQQKIIDKYYYNINKTMIAHYPYFKKRYPNLGILLDSKRVNVPNYEEWSNEFVKNVTVASLRKYSYLKEYLNFDQWANDFIGDIVFVDLWQKNKYDFFYRESKILLKQSLLRFYTTASTVDTQLPPLKNPNISKHLPAYYTNHKIISDPEIQWEVVKTFYWPREALSYVNTKTGGVILLFNSRRKYVERVLKLSRYQDPVWIEIGKWTLSNNVTTDQAASITFFEHSLAYLHHKDFLGAFLARHAAIQLRGWNSSNYNEIRKMFIGFAGNKRGNALFNEYLAICPIKTFVYKDRRSIYNYRVKYFTEKKDYIKVVENLNNLDPRKRNPEIQLRIKKIQNLISTNILKEEVSK